MEKRPLWGHIGKEELHMEYRKLGSTGLEVSAIGLGAEWLERHNAQEVKAVVDRAHELGTA